MNIDALIDDVRRLPRWAKVAFSARCAERLLPLYRLREDHPFLVEHLMSLDVLVKAAKLSSMLGEANPLQRSSLTAGGVIALEAAQAENQRSFAQSAAFVVVCASSAAKAAEKNADELFQLVTRVCEVIYQIDVIGVLPGAERDLMDLLNRARVRGWTDDTAIDASLLGPLWPEGTPPWFADGVEWQKEVLASFRESEAATQPTISILWDAEAISDEEYAELVEAIGDVVRAEGGVGVERVRSQGFELPVCSEVPR